MATYPAVDLTGSAEDGENPHGAVEPTGSVENGVLVILGVYPYEATLKVYVVFSDASEELVYTSTGGLERNYLGSVTLVPPDSVQLRVRRLQGWPVGSLTVRVDRS